MAIAPAGVNDEYEGVCEAGHLLRCAGAEQGAHQNAQIVAGNMDEISLVDIFAAPQPCAAHATPIEDMSEAAFDDLTALAHGLLADA
jgi:hypothetical protein